MKRKILSPWKILSLRKEGYCRCEAAIIAGRGILSLRSSDCSRASETEGEYLFARDVALIIKFPPWPLGYIHCVCVCSCVCVHARARVCNCASWIARAYAARRCTCMHADALTRTHARTCSGSEDSGRVVGTSCHLSQLSHCTHLAREARVV